MESPTEQAATIWTASTKEALALLEGEVSLNSEEMTQAGRLKQAADRDRFLAARALLRHALSDALDGEVGPELWQYREGAQGKPMMAPGLPQLEFNLSHAGDCLAVGVSHAGPIGVDIEKIDTDERPKVVADALTMREREFLDALPEDCKWENFIQIWTLKEACAKALGLGVFLDFGKLEATVEPLRVEAQQGVLGPCDTFDVETRRIDLDQDAYCLSVARICDTAGQTIFRFRQLGIEP